MMLGAVTEGRDNNWQLIRFLAASVVIVFHSYALTNTWGEEPLYRLIPEIAGGTLGVFAFFVTSGFLVTRSWQQRGRLVSFIAARVLRIYPALLVAALLTVALATWSSTLPWRAFLADPATQEYAWRAALAWSIVADLPAAYAANPLPHAMNGSLWTLPVELRLYVGLAIAGAAGVLGKRYAWTAVVLAFYALAVTAPDWFPMWPNTVGTRLFSIYFGLGSLAYVWRDRIPLSLWGLAGTLALIAANPWGIVRTALLPPLFTYSVLVLAYHPQLRWQAFNRIGDYSYGLYIYSFPIQQILIAKLGNPVASSPVLLLTLAFPLALALAAVSWHLLELPAIRLKSRFEGRNLRFAA
jgi:peptidoglycan/LPS O-acetylase OafA/YrhL